MSAWQIVALITLAVFVARLVDRGPVRTAAIARDRLLGLYHPATDYRGRDR